MGSPGQRRGVGTVMLRLLTEAFPVQLHPRAHTLNSCVSTYVCVYEFMCAPVGCGMCVEVSGQPQLSVLTFHLI